MRSCFIFCPLSDCSNQLRSNHFGITIEHYTHVGHLAVIVPVAQASGGLRPGMAVGADDVVEAGESVHELLNNYSMMHFPVRSIHYFHNIGSRTKILHAQFGASY